MNKTDLSFDLMWIFWSLLLGTFFQVFTLALNLYCFLFIVRLLTFREYSNRVLHNPCTFLFQSKPY